VSSPQPAEMSEMVTELAERLGVDEPAPTAKMVWALKRALADAESDVLGYLDRPITPSERTARGVWPDPFGTGGFTIASDEKIIDIVSATPEVFVDHGVPIATGTFTVVYRAGLDYKNDPLLSPIRRYVLAAAMNNGELLAFIARTTSLRGAVKSVSVSTEGQSKNVTYETLSFGGGGQAGADSPGALPSITTLDKWRRRGRRVHQAPDQPPDPRVYGQGGLVRDRDGFWNGL